MRRQTRIKEVGDLDDTENMVKESTIDKVIDYISYPFTCDRDMVEVKKKHDEEIKMFLDKIIKDENRKTYISKMYLVAAGILGIGLPLLIYKLNKKQRKRRSHMRSRTKRKTL